MKEQMLLRPHLLNKFDELPVNGNGVADWKKMEKALQIAMPIGLLSFILFGKGWLFTKKLMWLWISIATCGGAATTLAVYQSRQASLAQDSPSINNPNRGNTASHVVPAVNDTTIRVSKKNKTKKVAIKTVGTTGIILTTLTLNDTVVRPLRKLRPVRVEMDASGRRLKNARYIGYSGDTSVSQARIFKDTLVRSLKIARPVRVIKDTLVRSLKTARPVRVIRDTLVRSLKIARPARVIKDTLVRSLKTARPVSVFKDTLVRSLKIARPARVFKDTLVRSLKIARPARVIKDTLVRSLKTARPVRVIKDTLVRPVKRLNTRPAIGDTTIRLRKAKPSR